MLGSLFLVETDQNSCFAFGRACIPVTVDFEIWVLWNLIQFLQMREQQRPNLRNRRIEFNRLETNVHALDSRIWPQVVDFQAVLEWC